jgi:hypothetical protein
LLLVFLLALMAVPASAVAVLSNAGSTPRSDSHNVVYNETRFAAVFTVPAGPDYQLNSVTLSLAKISRYFGATATLNLHASGGTAPGSLVASLGSVAPASESFAPYTFSGSATLTGGQTYWLVSTGINLKHQRTNTAPSGVFTDNGTRFFPLQIVWLNLNQPFVLTIDADPLVTVNSITRASANPTSAASVDWNIAFSSGVSGLSASNFALAASGVSGASITNVSGSGASWTVTASTGSGDGTLGLNMISGTGIINLPFTGESYTVDKTQSNTVISTTATDPTNISPIPVTVTFSEDMTGFEASDVQVSNGVVSNFAGGPAVYTFDVTPAAPGVVTVSVPAGVAVDGGGNGNEAAAPMSINFASVGLPVIRLALMNDGTDATTTVPNPAPASTPAYHIISGGSGAHVDGSSGAFIYAFDEGAPLGVYLVIVEVSSGGHSFNQLIEITLLPAPPPVPTCAEHNFDEGGVVRSGALSDAVAPMINCRVLYQHGSSTTWLGSDMYSAGSLGVEGILDLGVQQAIDIFSPGGMTYFDGGAVFCLRGQGSLIWLAASQMPRHAEIIGSYSVAEWPGFTCATLFEPGTLILVRENPIQ